MSSRGPVKRRRGAPLLALRLAVVSELFAMMLHHRNWILLPLVIALVVVGGLTMLAGATPLAPFLYPLF